MSEAHDLETRITANFDKLSPKQQALARLILDNRYYASFASAAEIGEKVGASAATVVRLCQALGYEGLPDLQEAIRQELPTYLTAVERLERRLSLPQYNGAVPQRVFATDIRNLQRTANKLSEATLEQAVQLLVSAHEILVVGSGIAAAMAHFLAYSLQVIGYRARVIPNGGIALAVNLAHLTDEDVVIGISVWRYVRSTVRALEYARSQGARIIAITDSIVSPLARQADLTFEVATEGTAHSLSMTALTALINTLVAGVSLHDPERTRAALRRVERQVQADELLLS